MAVCLDPYHSSALAVLRQIVGTRAFSFAASRSHVKGR